MNKSFEQIMYERGYLWNKTTHAWDKKTRAGLQNPEPKPDTGVQPKETVCHESRSSGGRVTLTLCSYRTRLLDPDNLIGGCKFLIDALRYHGVIPGDSPDLLDIVVKQVKSHNERTEVTVDAISRNRCSAPVTCGPLQTWRIPSNPCMVMLLNNWGR